MPIKSWSFVHNGHPIRAEIWWRFTGWNRRRIYIDNKRVADQCGWLRIGHPLVAELDTLNGQKQKLKFCFRTNWTRFKIDCRFAADRDPLTLVPSARVYQQLQYHPEKGEEIQSVFPHPVGCLLIFGFLLMMCVLYPPLMIAGGAIHAFQEKRLRARMQKLGRWLPWSEIERRIQSMQKPCTLIIQMANLTTSRAWWTTDDLVTQSPLPLADEMDAQHPAAYKTRHPLNEWCQFKYFD